MGGNPLKYSDPKGLFFWDVLDLGFFAQSLYEYSQCSSSDNAINLGLDTIGLLPVIPALSTLRRVDNAINTTKSRVFWSGSNSKKAAEVFAKANGGETLDMTLTGKVLGRITTPSTFKYVKPLWSAASKRFAKGARGQVNVFHSSKGIRLESVWSKREYPIIKKQGNNINYHIVN